MTQDTFTASEHDYVSLEASLLNTAGSTSLAKRFRALFALRGLGTKRAIDIIGKAFADDSALLGHELAYCLGQIGSPNALPKLAEVLKDTRQHPMVRHEAAEAMGAISSLDSLPLLEHYRDDAKTPVAIRETCEIAVDKIRYDHSLLKAGETTQRSIYDSIDPAPPLASSSTAAMNLAKASVQDLRQTYLDDTKPLFERYRAMFALRNNASDEAVLALADGFRDASALFRHEIAYVFGQLCSPVSVPSLVTVLEDDQEDEMVRHEAAEALGSIAVPEVYPVLRKWLEKPDSPRVVRESCQVALDIADHEASGALHYADGRNDTASAVPPLEASSVVSVTA